MARPTRAHKDAAFRSQNASGITAATCAAAAAAAAPIPVAGIFAAAGLGVISAVFSVRGILAGKVVRDPPRDDFREPTEPVESRRDLNPLRESPIGEPAIALIEAVDETNRLLDAMVIALERASGAELAGDLDAAETRLGEANRFAEAAGVGFRNSSASARRLGEALTPYREARLPDEEPLRRLIRRARRLLARSTLASELPSETLSAVERMGFSRDELRVPLRIGDDEFPIRRLVVDLGDLAEADYLYGEYLVEAARTRDAFELEKAFEDAGA